MIVKALPMRLPDGTPPLRQPPGHPTTTIITINSNGSLPPLQSHKPSSSRGPTSSSRRFHPPAQNASATLRHYSRLQPCSYPRPFAISPSSARSRISAGSVVPSTRRVAAGIATLSTKRSCRAPRASDGGYPEHPSVHHRSRSIGRSVAPSLVDSCVGGNRWGEQHHYS